VTPDDIRRARDIALVDVIDAFRREPIAQPVWRVVRAERDPVQGSPSHSRWCNARFDVLYTSFEKDGAIAEMHAFLSLQPVFPSQPKWLAHELRVSANRTLRLADLPTLRRLGVDTSRYKDRNYARTQEIADAAYFLDFDGLIAPSARWSCLNAVLFTERLAPEQIVAVGKAAPVDWRVWRKKHRRP
jgi:RES domain